MVYTSFPVYQLDPPNWNQQQIQHQFGGGDGGGARVAELHQFQPTAPSQKEGGRPTSSVAADRARQAKTPQQQPEPALKCPRCESTNTKFCYFNNYSLSQPRHFCKTCRRYWTRGGALRNVPVGGGCRRNKRSRSGGGGSKNNSKTGNSASATATVMVSGSGISSNNIQAPPQLPFLPSLHAMADYGAASIGLSFDAIPAIDEPVDYRQAAGSGMSMNGLEQWRLQQVQQLPFFTTGLGQPAAVPAPTTQVGLLYSYDGDRGGGEDGLGFGGHDNVHGKPTTTAGVMSQLASVKMEERQYQLVEHQQQQQWLNLPRHYLGIPAGIDQFWSSGHGGSVSTGIGGSNTNTGGVGWNIADLSGFGSTTTGSLS